MRKLIARYKNHSCYFKSSLLSFWKIKNIVVYHVLKNEKQSKGERISDEIRLEGGENRRRRKEVFSLSNDCSSILVVEWCTLLDYWRDFGIFGMGSSSISFRLHGMK